MSSRWEHSCTLAAGLQWSLWPLLMTLLMTLLTTTLLLMTLLIRTMIVMIVTMLMTMRMAMMLMMAHAIGAPEWAHEMVLVMALAMTPRRLRTAHLTGCAGPPLLKLQGAAPVVH